jgi:hypothetical protein
MVFTAEPPSAELCDAALAESFSVPFSTKRRSPELPASFSALQAANTTINAVQQRRVIMA